MRLSFGIALLAAALPAVALSAIALSAMVLSPGIALAQDGLDPTDAPAVVRTATDDNNRVTIPVSIGGRGPYPFVVDTGSQRTVISRELADSLALVANTPVRVLSMTGSSDVDTVTVPGISFGSTRMDDVQAPVFAGEHLGGPGLLGLDGLHRKRLVLNFRTGRMEIKASSDRKVTVDRDVIVVTARSKAGQLILMDSEAEGYRVQVVLDTGSEYSVGNMALLKKLTKRRPKGFDTVVSMTSVTGDTLLGQWGMVEKLKMGTLAMTNLPVMFAEASPFAELGLTDKPALLLGVGALRGFDRVAIDFGRKRVDFLLPDEGSLQAMKLAALERFLPHP